MRLYHFTGLLLLPQILREGLSKGDVPTKPMLTLKNQPNAVNLTRLPGREDQAGWSMGAAIDCTKVRITVDLDEGSVLSFKRVRQMYKIKSSWAKALNKHGGADPYNHFFYFGVIPPEQFRAIETFNGQDYEEPSAAWLAELIALIEEEKNNLEFEEVNGMLTVDLKDGVSGSWLLDGVGPLIVIEH